MLRFVAIFVFVFLATSTGLVGNVSAQSITIKTSADNHDNSFFGEAVLQIIVTDTNADDDSAIEQLGVDLLADPDNGSSDSGSFMIPETSESSGRFEFFLVHKDAMAVGPDDLDPQNSAGTEGDGSCVSDCAPFITFGPGGALDIQSELYDNVRFEIKANDVESEVIYEETKGTLTLDRDSYGTTSVVYISVTDQDANSNPFERDQFVVDPNSNPNIDLLQFNGASIVQQVVFTETSDNSAVFEGRYKLGESMLATSEAISITLDEKANYGETLSAPENDSNDSDEVSFVIGNSDGTIDMGGGRGSHPTWDPIISVEKKLYSIGGTVQVTVNDLDASNNTSAADDISLSISSRNSQIDVLGHETGVNTGIFEATFQLSNKTDQESGSIFPGGSLEISYVDARPADYSDSIQAGKDPQKEFTANVDVQLPVFTGTEATALSTPVVKNMAGRNGTNVGASLMLSTSISNNNDKSQPFVVLIQVTDDNGVGVFLALQSGTLEPTGWTDIGVLWRPELPGHYELRTFAISEIGGQAEPLSTPETSEVLVIV